MRPITLSLLALPFCACGDKDTDDTAATSEDSGTASSDDTGTSGSDGPPAFSDMPESGSLVAELRTADGTGRLVCDLGISLGQATTDTWIFNSLLHADDCQWGGGATSGLLASNNMPTTNLSAYPGGSAQVEMDTGNLATRLYGHEATRFEQEVLSWDAGTSALQAVLWVQWPDGEATIWVDGTFN